MLLVLKTFQSIFRSVVLASSSPSFGRRRRRRRRSHRSPLRSRFHFFAQIASLLRAVRIHNESGIIGSVMDHRRGGSCRQRRWLMKDDLRRALDDFDRGRLRLQEIFFLLLLLLNHYRLILLRAALKETPDPLLPT
jgi:hypothetical protein